MFLKIASRSLMFLSIILSHIILFIDFFLIRKFRKLKQNVKINLIKLSTVALTKVFYNKFNFISLILSKLFKKDVEFELIKIYYPVNESFILAKSIGLLGQKLRKRFKYFDRRWNT